MGLFNKNKKQQLIEIEKEFDYNKMMVAAKEVMHKEECTINDEMTIAKKVMKLLAHSTVKFVNEREDIGFIIPSETETNKLGIYDKNNNLVLVLTYDLDKKILFRYMVNYYKDNYGINDAGFSSKLIKPVFTVTEINTKDLPTEFILAYLSIHLFSYESNFNDFLDMCFFSYALTNTMNQYYHQI